MQSQQSEPLTRRVYDAIVAGIVDGPGLESATGAPRKQIHVALTSLRADRVVAGGIGRLVIVRKLGQRILPPPRSYAKSRKLTDRQKHALQLCTSVYGKAFADLDVPMVAVQKLVKRGLLDRYRGPATSARARSRFTHKARYYATDLGFEVLAECQSKETT